MRRRLVISEAMNSLVGGEGEVAVVGGAITKMVNVLGGRVRVLVPAEGFVDGGFPFEG